MHHHASKMCEPQLLSSFYEQTEPEHRVPSQRRASAAQMPAACASRRSCPEPISGTRTRSATSAGGCGEARPATSESRRSGRHRRRHAMAVARRARGLWPWTAARGTSSISVSNLESNSQR